jgi:hypothetical protein
MGRQKKKREKTILRVFRAWTFSHSLGQTETSTHRFGMSAFPPIATKLRTSLEVRFVPTRDIDHGWRLSQRGS